MLYKTLSVALLAGALLNTAPAQNKPGEKPAPISDETVRLIDSVEGSSLYRSYCAVCHGADARGGGPMAASLKVVPSDLTRISARNRGAYPLARVERIISGQEPVPGGHGTSSMPVWGPIFSQIAWDTDLGRLRIHNLAVHLGKIQAR